MTNRDVAAHDKMGDQCVNEWRTPSSLTRLLSSLLTPRNRGVTPVFVAFIFHGHRQIPFTAETQRAQSQFFCKPFSPLSASLR